MTDGHTVRVLIADDHQVVRAGLRMILTEPPTTSADECIDVVGEASGGEEAVRLAAHVKPDVVIMDLMMPRVDGIEAIRRLRSAGVDCPVLILSTAGDAPSIRGAIEAGAIGYLIKDTPKDDLRRAVIAAAQGIPALDPRAQHVLMRQLSEPASPTPFDGLTPRELDVLRLIARGKSNKEIAAALFVSVGTVKGYVSAILPKLGVGDRTQAALLAAKHGLV
jgi:two-component system, NarL family, response regulator LiaR